MPSLKVTDATFARAVIDAGLPVFVDFWADWCGPCHAVAPLLEDLADELQGRVIVAKLNIDENPDTTALQDIHSVPTFKIFKNGELAAQDIGAYTKDALRAWILETIA
ncbi:thioredoxin [Beijerinckia indica]|uniref:Thioredoxin n=1 Tax=Beijerinckia indica subsp. indica (strain ATCC 9039 / DSM 1715 / NCIMB 8712) TaxID=395963 RepID=B2IFZ1_BEII9|nr:thioredoxin [Beijerinckia indica]ACB95730.1 thioredoxin [Beijerinckia indica subsp. indica ATCC 9039]